MKLLVVTEKGSPYQDQRDGGARVVETLRQAFDNSLSIMHFGPYQEPSANWNFDYPFYLSNRFERRLANASFIAKQVKKIEKAFTHILFIHISMQFGHVALPLSEEIETWTFPMLLTPSYKAAGETLPAAYTELEGKTLQCTDKILTPSYLEKCQLINQYAIPKEKIHVVPRGVESCLLRPKIRSLDGPPRLCTIGSIKPQKNNLGLVRLFAKVRDRYPGATLKMIGPIQDREYSAKVNAEISQLGLERDIEQTGHIPPTQLATAIEGANLHLSTTNCETFGRTIFETLASGLPNVVKRPNNAAAEFLEKVPYAYFFDSEGEALKAIETILSSLSHLSSMALEIGQLYDDQRLAQLLKARILNREILAISDFDGTLYHKHSDEATRQSIDQFNRYPYRALCSARSLEDLMEQIKNYHLEVEWIIASSGSIIADGKGNPLSIIAFEAETLFELEKKLPQSRRITFREKVVQIATSAENLPTLMGQRIEVYQNIAYIAPWQASKLRATHWLLEKIGWEGQVEVFGDGPYDVELIRYFDGTLIASDTLCAISPMSSSTPLKS